MRNLAAYPVTLDEVIDGLTRLQAEAQQRIETDMICGDMTPLLLQEAIDFIRKAEESGLTYEFKLY